MKTKNDHAYQDREWALKIFQTHSTTALTLALFWITGTVSLLHAVEQSHAVARQEILVVVLMAFSLFWAGFLKLLYDSTRAHESWYKKRFSGLQSSDILPIGLPTHISGFFYTVTVSTVAASLLTIAKFRSGYGIGSQIILFVISLAACAYGIRWCWLRWVRFPEALHGKGYLNACGDRNKGTR